MEKPNSADIALYCAAIWSAIGLYHYIMGNTHTLEGLIRMLVGISASLGWKSESLRSKAGFRFEQQEGVRQQLLDGVQSGGRCVIHFPYSRKLI